MCITLAIKSYYDRKKREREGEENADKYSDKQNEPEDAPHPVNAPAPAQTNGRQPNAGMPKGVNRSEGAKG